MCECSSDDGNGDVSVGVGDLIVGIVRRIERNGYVSDESENNGAALNMITFSFKHLIVVLQKEEILILFMNWLGWCHQ